MLGALIRRLRCRRVHAWVGYAMTDSERELYRSASLTTGSWHRKSCRWCKGHDDEMPHRPTPSERANLLDNAALKRIGFNARIGPVSRVLAPGYGQCLRCRTAWAFVKGHDTFYGDGHGCFPLCEACWSELTPAERLPYYERMWAKWRADDEVYGLAPNPPETWDRIRAAVLAGK